MNTPSEVVVLLHGLGRSPASFFRMARYLRARGYLVCYPWYRSTQGDLESIARSVAAKIPPAGKVSFVGHSLGGLIALKLWQQLPEERRGRLVQLGTPNLGSEVASQADFLQPLIGPVLGELRPRETSVVAEQIGAIAGDAAPEALGRLTGLDGPNDGLVTVESALAAAPTHRMVVPVVHALLMMDGRVIEAVEHFLRKGWFPEPAQKAQSD